MFFLDTDNSLDWENMKWENVWVGSKDVSPEVSFTLITVPKLTVNPPRVALGSVTTEATLWRWAGSGLMELLVPPGMDINAGTPPPLLHDRVLMAEWSVQRSHPGTIFRFSVWHFHLGAWAICLCTISIWGKWILTKAGECLSWGKNQVVDSQCPVVMKSV